MVEHNQVHAVTSSVGKFGIVPEPSARLLLLIGMAGLFGLGRLRVSN